MEELKPCPFCGGRANCYQGEDWTVNPFPFFVRCDDCKAETQHCSKIEYAIAAWNRRADDGKQNNNNP